MDLTTQQALSLWRRVTLDQVLDSAPDLTARQVAILLTVYMDPPPHTVRGLARQLGVTKPVITRALDTMGRLELLNRRRDDNDRRNVLVQRTVAGSQFLDQLAETIKHRAGEG